MMLVTSPWLSVLVLVAIPAIVLPLVWPRRHGAHAVAAGPGQPRRGLGLCGREPRRGAHHAGLRPRAAVVDRFAAARRARVRGRAATAEGPRRADGADHGAGGDRQHRRRAVGRRRRCRRRRDDAAAGSASSSSTRCSRPVRWPSCRRSGARSTRRPAPPSGWPRCWPCVPEIRAPAEPVPLPEPPRGAIALRRRALRLSLASRPSALDGVALAVGAGRDGGAGRPLGRRQEHRLQPAAALLRSRRGRGHDRRRCCRPGAARRPARAASRWCRRTWRCSPIRCGEHPLRHARRPATRIAARARDRRPGRRLHPRPAAGLRRRGSASAA